MINNLFKSIVLFSIVACFIITFQQKVTAQSFLFVNNLKSLSKVSKAHNVRSDITNFAEKFLGIAYRSGGTTPAGFDCSGYVHFIFKQYGYDLAHSSRELASFGTSVKKQDAAPGDLVIFAYNGIVHHVAIVYANHNGSIDIIHSSTSRGVVIENIDASAYWSKRFHSIRRVI